MYPRRDTPPQDIESSRGHPTELARRVMLEHPGRLSEVVVLRFQGPDSWNLIPRSGLRSRLLSSPFKLLHGPNDELILRLFL